MRKYLPIIIVVGGSLLLLLVLTYWKSPPKDILDESIWRVVTLDEASLLKDSNLTIRFHNRKISGSSGCNRFTGRYSITGKNIAITEFTMLSTDRCMNPGIMQQEGVFISLLQAVDTFTYSPRELLLATADSRSVRFAPLGGGE